MRTRIFAAATSLTLVLGGAALTGCDDTTSGQQPEDTTPPKLVKVMVQDPSLTNLFGNGRGIAVNLLNNKDPHPACDDANPCPPSVWPIGNTCGTINGGAAPGENPTAQIGDPGFCDVTKKNCHCYDPESAMNVPAPVDQATLGGGVRVRVVFSKTIDPKVETVFYGTCQPMGHQPCNTATQATDCKSPDTCTVQTPPVPKFGLPTDLAELVAADGTKVPGGIVIYDIVGNPTVTSNPTGAPYGPALQIAFAGGLTPNTKYTLKLASDKILDIHGQKLQAADGSALPVPYTLDFTTEPLMVMGPGNCPSQFCGLPNTGTLNYPDVSAPASISPFDTIQLQTNTDVGTLTSNSTPAPLPTDFIVGDKIVLTGKGGAKTIPNCNASGISGTCVQAVLDGCTGTRIIDIIVEDAPGGNIIEIPAGTYTLSVSDVPDLAGTTKISAFSQDITVLAEKPGCGKPDAKCMADADCCDGTSCGAPDAMGNRVCTAQNDARAVQTPEQCAPPPAPADMGSPPVDAASHG